MLESSEELIRYLHLYIFQKKDQHFWKTRLNGTKNVFRILITLDLSGQKPRQRDKNSAAESDPPSKRRSTLERNKDLCIFCEMNTLEKNHEFTTYNANKSVSQMATEMEDMDLMMKLSEGDLVAIEAKYHFNCLSRYRNHYRSHLRARSDLSSSLHSMDKKAKARAFAELVSHIESCLEEDTNIFKLADLHSIYQDRLRNLGVLFSVNNIYLKEDITNHFFDYGIQEQSSGTNTVLVFPEGMKINCFTFVV